MTEQEIASLKIGDRFHSHHWHWTVITKEEYIQARGSNDYFLNHIGPEPIFLRCDEDPHIIEYVSAGGMHVKHLEPGRIFYRAFASRQELTGLYLATKAVKER